MTLTFDAAPVDWTFWLTSMVLLLNKRMFPPPKIPERPSTVSTAMVLKSNISIIPVVVLAASVLTSTLISSENRPPMPVAARSATRSAVIPVNSDASLSVRLPLELVSRTSFPAAVISVRSISPSAVNSISPVPELIMIPSIMVMPPNVDSISIRPFVELMFSSICKSSSVVSAIPVTACKPCNPLIPPMVNSAPLLLSRLIAPPASASRFATSISTASPAPPTSTVAVKIAVAALKASAALDPPSVIEPPEALRSALPVVITS
ncbi:hypothetical protein V202x_23750 [Gimesia aquarii]|uniref:Uncharacterized protein n=1 Tax=Gimesia aquarii TaxID=2527964 RepID=A0A517WUS1_9PLAN|nr:hypothetical protein V202x_23750 [Gimesia aquarii]